MNWVRRKLNSATYRYMENRWRFEDLLAEPERVTERCGPLLERFGCAPPARDA